MPLNDRVALVAGGTGALGSVIAKRLGAEGCVVFVSYVHEKELTCLPATLKGRLNTFKADMTDELQVKGLYDVVLASSSRVDIVVNTVGGFLPRKPLVDVSVEEWDLMMNTNLKSAFLSTREALRRMRGQSYGRIINISAMVGLRPSPERIPYSISKASVSLLTDLVAQEVKGSGITVNAIAPSIIATSANLASMPDHDSTKWVTPAQVADLVCFLCSAESGVITGTTIKAYGGL